MALIDIGGGWVNSDDTAGALFQKFLGGCLKSAAYIQSESPSTENHANRLIWANAIFSDDPQSVVSRVRQVIRYGLATNSTMQAGPNDLNDNDIEFIIASAIDRFATGN